MPIYNVETYLEEAIESIVRQTIGFQEHIQLVLVNDGSPDNSHLICEKYKTKYPENVLYIEKENGGVSSARNLGIQQAEGKYLSFLDPDDYLSENVLENVYAFFEENEVDLVSIPMFKFGIEVGEHPLNDKFYETDNRIIDITKDYESIQLSGPSSFFRKAALQHTFDENMKYAEDAVFVNEVIVASGKYGALSKENKYFYRRRPDNSSATQSGQYDEDWYIGLIEKFFKPIMETSIEKHGHILKYVQSLMMYDLGWRLIVPKNAIMTTDFMEDFFRKIKRLLVEIDEEIIENQKHLHLHQKRYLLGLKNSDTGKKNGIEEKNDDVILHDGRKTLARLSTEQITIDFINIEGNCLVLTGHFDSSFHKDDIELYLQTESGMTFLAEDISDQVEKFEMLTIVVKEYKGFKISVPIDDFVNIRMFGKWGEVALPLKMKFGEKSYLSSQFEQNYTFIDGYGIFYQAEDKLTLMKKESKFTELKKEMNVLQALVKTKEKTKIKAAMARIGYQLKKLFKKREKWVFVGDTKNKVGPIEQLFKHSVENHKEIEAVFIIDKNTEDFTRLKQYGKVVDVGSYQHKIEVLLADKLLSTSVDEWIVNPFFTTKIYYQNLMTFQFVFLQTHQPTKTTLDWLNRYKRNISVAMPHNHEQCKKVIAEISSLKAK